MNRLQSEEFLRSEPPTFGLTKDSPLSQPRKFDIQAIDDIFKRNREVNKIGRFHDDPPSSRILNQCPSQSSIQQFVSDQDISIEHLMRFFLMAVEISRLNQYIMELQSLNQRDENLIQLEEQIEGMSSTIEHWRNLCQTKDEELDKLRGQYRENNQSTNESQNLQSEIIKLKNQNRQLIERLNSIEQQVEYPNNTISEIEELHQLIQEQQEEIKRHKEDQIKYENQIQSLLNSNKMENEKNLDLYSEIQQLQGEIQKLQDYNLYLQQQLSVRPQMNQNLEQQLQRLLDENYKLERQLQQERESDKDRSKKADQKELNQYKNMLVSLISQQQDLQDKFITLKSNIQERFEENSYKDRYLSPLSGERGYRPKQPVIVSEMPKVFSSEYQRVLSPEYERAPSTQQSQVRIRPIQSIYTLQNPVKRNQDFLD